MSKSNLIPKLTRELGRNPKKSAVLALLLAVAVWFWVPLVWKWVAPATHTSAKPTEKQVAEAADKNIEATPPQANVTEKHSHLSWQHLADLLESHQSMKTAALRKEGASPFGKKEIAAAIEDEQPGEESAESPAATAITTAPDRLGLSLTSTITGRKNLAMINGNACGVGTILVVPYQGTNVEWTVVGILPDAVHLQNGNNVQKLERKPLQSSMQLTLASRRSAVSQDPGVDRVFIRSLQRE